MDTSKLMAFGSALAVVALVGCEGLDAARIASATANVVNSGAALSRGDVASLSTGTTAPVLRQNKPADARAKQQTAEQQERERQYKEAVALREKQSKVTADQFRKVFAHDTMTPEKIVEAIRKAKRRDTGFKVEEMEKALTWEKGFSVLGVAQREHLALGPMDMKLIEDSIYSSLDGISGEENFKKVIDCLVNDFQNVRLHYHGPSEYYEKVIEQIPEGAIADYMLGKRLNLGKLRNRLIQKSPATMAKIAAAKKAQEAKQAAEEKKRVAQEEKRKAEEAIRNQQQNKKAAEFKKDFADAAMTPQKIVEEMVKAVKGETSYSQYEMAGAMTWEKGFEVMRILKDTPESGYGGQFREIMEDAVERSLEGIQGEATFKRVIGSLPKSSKWLDRGLFDKGTRFYGKVIEQITEPSVADYMFAKDLPLEFQAKKLIKKLSAAKKSELLAAAKERSAKCTDKLVFEGFYVGMPYIDAEILSDSLGLNILEEKGRTGNLIDFTTEDFADSKPMAECRISGFHILPKGWVKFIKVEDDGMMPYQFFRQYVEKKPGKAEKLEYLFKYEDVAREGSVFKVYKSTKLGTKVTINEYGTIIFAEL